METITIPSPDLARMSTLDLAVREIETQATAYVCATALDFEAGGAAIARIRSLDGMFEDIYKPIKQAHDANKLVTLNQEKLKRVPLANAKLAISNRMLAWKAADDRRRNDERLQIEAAERKRAEDARLATALQMEARQKETGNAALQHDIEQLLDQPLDIAPSYAPPAAKAGSGVKVVGRMQVSITDTKAFLVSLGATLMAENLGPGDQIAKPTLTRYASRTLVGILDNPALHEKIADAFLPALRTLKTARGDAFNVPGVTAERKDGLG